MPSRATVADRLDPSDPTARLTAPGTRTWLILALVGAVLFVGPGPLAPTTATHDHVTSRGPSAPRTTIAASRVGIDENYRPFSVGPRELNADFNAIKASSAEWVSFDFDWSTVQDIGPTSYNWAPLDKAVGAANARGLKVLGIPDYTPSWARAAGTDNKYPPTNNGDYINFVATAVTRYAPQGVHTWAIWNEPNNPDFWKPNPDVAAYTDLLKATYPAIKTIDPSAVVLTGGTAPASGPVSPANWLSGLYRPRRQRLLRCHQPPPLRRAPLRPRHRRSLEPVPTDPRAAPPHGRPRRRRQEDLGHRSRRLYR